MNDEEKIAAVLDQVPLPPGVSSKEFTVGIDHAGYPAAFIYVIVIDEVAGIDWLRANAEEIRQAVRAAFRQAGIEHWPYIRFRTVSEVAELKAMERF